MLHVVQKAEQDLLVSEASDQIVSALQQVIDKTGRVNFAVCGGRSVADIFDQLALKTELDWSKVHFFMVDERLVPLEDPQSNFKIVKQHLIDPLFKGGHITLDNVHPFYFESQSTDKGLSAYVETLGQYGGAYDVLLLSAGEDGHVGGLYPHHHSMQNLSPYFLTMDDSPKPPPERMTLSKTLLTQAQAAVLLIFGEGKRDAYTLFMNAGLDTYDCPAKLVNTLPQAYLFTDIATERI